MVIYVNTACVHFEQRTTLGATLIQLIRTLIPTCADDGGLVGRRVLPTLVVCRCGQCINLVSTSSRYSYPRILCREFLTKITVYTLLEYCFEVCQRNFYDSLCLIVRVFWFGFVCIFFLKKHQYAGHIRNAH